MLSSATITQRIATLIRHPGRAPAAAAATALAVCAAVILNVGPFANPRADGARNPARATTLRVLAQSSAPTPAAPADAAPVAAFAPAPLLLTPDTKADAGAALVQVSTLSDAAIADATKAAEPAAAAAEPAPPDAIVGVWAPAAAACSARNFRDGDLPTVIDAGGAWAGDTFCLFARKEKTDAGWKVLAKCANPRESWTSQVRLSVRDNRLTWASKRGTQTYARCAPDLLMARAN
jgi:hypothetical protein